MTDVISQCLLVCLQEFVTATDIRITLTRINTYGDEIFSSLGKILNTYFYAISDFAVGGR